MFNFTADRRGQWIFIKHLFGINDEISTIQCDNWNAADTLFLIMGDGVTDQVSDDSLNTGAQSAAVSCSAVDVDGALVGCRCHES